MNKKIHAINLSEKLVNYFKTLQNLVNLNEVKQLMPSETKNKLLKELFSLIKLFDAIQSEDFQSRQYIQYVKQLTTNLSNINKMIKKLYGDIHQSIILQYISKLDRTFDELEEEVDTIIISSSLVRVTRGGSLEEKSYELKFPESDVVVKQTQGKIELGFNKEIVDIDKLTIGKVRKIVVYIVEILSQDNEENKVNDNSESNFFSYLLKHNLLSNNDINILATFFEEIFTLLKEKGVVKQ